ncbi:MAG: hypothetical protein E6Q97_00205 [Desulfurellales bacterium]|nr:MAG: hypothetical protein E6Q97_00205 [Desulfurellales bacterium]
MKTNSEPEKRTYWVTKYALTEGIHEVTGYVKSNTRGLPMLVADWPGAPNGWALFQGEDWHDSLGKARERTVRMAERKIIALQRLLSKMQQIALDSTRAPIKIVVCEQETE